MARSKRQNRAEILAGIERHRIETAAARKEALRLQMTGAEATVTEIEEEGDDGQKRRKVIVRARRIDVFQLLLERRALPQESFDAVRAYETDLALSMGWETPERSGEFVSRSCEGAPGQNVTQEMIEASRRVADVRRKLSVRDVRLLDDLLKDHGALLTRWRDTVHRITGETNDDAHTAVVRAMASNLAEAMRPPPSHASGGVRQKFTPHLEKAA